MPAYPTLSADQQEDSFNKSTADANQENLAELPPLPSIASRVSHSLSDQEDETDAAAPELRTLSVEPLPIRLTHSEKNDHSWEPDITASASEENDTSNAETIDEVTTPANPFAEEERTEQADSPTPKEPAPTITKSPLIRAGLLEKIRSNKADHSPTAEESPFRAITSQTSETRLPKESTNDDPAVNTSTPFAETEHPDSTTRQQTKFTDKDLQDALRPLIGSSSSSSEPFVNLSNNANTYLEPMLRSTVRRAIAEQMAEASPFRDVPGWNKLAWKLRALMSSRTYDDILFDQTRRYQVEEVFLLRPQTRSLISYASNNPARHAKSSKVEGTVKKIATKTAGINNNQASILNWGDNRQLVIRPGKYSTLAAVVHGSANHVLEADLDYLLSQVEDRLGKSLEDSHQAHLQILQPMLECCLLIQSLATSN